MNSLEIAKEHVEHTKTNCPHYVEGWARECDKCLAGVIVDAIDKALEEAARRIEPNPSRVAEVSAIATAQREAAKIARSMKLIVKPEPIELSDTLESFVIKGRGLTITLNENDFPKEFKVGTRVIWKGSEHVVSSIEYSNSRTNTALILREVSNVK